MCQYCQSRSEAALSKDFYLNYFYSCSVAIFPSRYVLILSFVFFSVDVINKIDIPSVFVSEETATSLKDYYYETG